MLREKVPWKHSQEIPVKDSAEVTAGIFGDCFHGIFSRGM